MFLLFFLVFTLIFTIFENISIAGISVLLIGVILLIYQTIRKKKILSKKLIGIILLSFVLAMSTFVVKEWRYYGGMDSGFRGNEVMKQDGFPIRSGMTNNGDEVMKQDGFRLSREWRNEAEWREDKQREWREDDVGNNGNYLNIQVNWTLIWMWIIEDISSKGKYVFKYQNNEYLLYSKKEYSIGDQLWIVGRITPPAPSKIEGWWYRTISSSTFDIPLFSGSFDFAKWMKMKGWKGTIYEDNSIVIKGSKEQIGFPLSREWGTEVWRAPEWGTQVWVPAATLDPRSSAGQAAGMSSGRNPGPTQFCGAGCRNEVYIGVWRQANPSTPIPSVSLIKQAKKSIQEKVIESYGKNRISGLILGMLIGDKSQIPESEYQNFIDSWLVHLVAVSGWNILMIVVFLQCILFFIPFYVRLGVILCTIVGYSLICGLDSSVFRAVLMWGINMLAIFRGREINIWRVLSISALIMLIINPYFLVYDTGFLLSYSAIIGIIAMTSDEWQGTRDKSQVSHPILWLKKWLQYIYKSYISPSIWASIGIFPIIIFFMGKINILGIIGNLFVLPIVPFVMIYGFISIWVYSWLRWDWILWIENIFVQYIYKISELLSQYGLYLTVTWLRFKYVVLLICIGFFVAWRLGSGRNPEPTQFCGAGCRNEFRPQSGAPEWGTEGREIYIEKTIKNKIIQ